LRENNNHLAGPVKPNEHVASRMCVLVCAIARGFLLLIAHLAHFFLTAHGRAGGARRQQIRYPESTCRFASSRFVALRMKRYLSLLLLLPSTSIAQLTTTPATVTLQGKDDRQRIVVNEAASGRVVDRTREAKFSIDNPAVASVSAEGVVTPTGDGSATVTATFGSGSATTKVTVRDGARFRPVTFERDIEPLLARMGCNAGACHGKARGQNGFALSILGFDTDFDYAAIVTEAKGRRLFPAAPESSLLLRKASGQTPHGGGRKLPADGPAYAAMKRWIEAGTPRTPSSAPKVERISIEPGQRIMGFRQAQQLLVTAYYTDGSSADVTHLATYQSNESVYASVDANGLVKAGPIPGEAAIMARFMEKFAVANVLIPMPGELPADLHAKLPRQNFIDGHVWDKLKLLGLTPSALASDATFHRRAFLDVIGRLPNPEETRAFFADKTADKRMKLIDRLLERPEYADWWASKWADLLRPNPYHVGIKAVFNIDAWLRESFRRNKPYDQFVREIITAQGSTFRDGPTVFFRNRREPDEITTMVSQLFLGVRLDCARCHHHPFEIYGQEDFYSFAAYFARVGHKGVGISAPISGGEEVIFNAPTGSVKHPLTGKVLPPRPLFGKATEVTADNDPRQVLADWVTSPDNPYFAKVIVNRVWADLMGRGIVDPVDDLRATNPPSNVALLDALAADFRKNGHDLKKLIRTIATSYAYGLSTTPNDRNLGDSRNYSRHYRQRLRGEVLLDAISDITGVPEKFDAHPSGTRAMGLWTVRAPSVFLDTLSRPDPNQDPPCERTPDSSVVQALHLMNAPNLHRKVTADEGQAAKLAASSKTVPEIVEELYLLAYCRLPSEAERSAASKRFEKKEVTRRKAAEDLLWALVNTPEFVFND
jgi:hypothetical protein